MLFGKLPAHGDFVSRGLDPVQRDALDAWLSATLLDAREAHGEAFEALYGQAPPWRFAHREAEGWRAGALVPSVDAAGRLFPAMAGYAGLDAADAGAAAAAAEALLFRALTEGLDADATVAALAGAGATAGDAVEGWWTLGTGDGEAGFAPARVGGERPPALARLMLTRVPG